MATKISSSFLHSCPFCGSDNVELKYGNETGMAGSQSWDIWVECEECSARGAKLQSGIFSPKGQKEKCVELWNRRIAGKIY